MKVLLLPYNIASDISHKVRALKSLGVQAKGLTFGANTIQTAKGVKSLPHYSINPLRTRLNQLRAFAEIVRAIQWADIIHWTCFFNILPYDYDKRLVKFFNKPGVVQWYGSDIRNPKIDSAVNPYYKNVLDQGYEYNAESAENSICTQQDFAQVGFYPLEFIGTDHYIDTTLFPKRFRTWQHLVLSEHTPNYPEISNKKPLIIHSPSAPIAKGTQYVLQAIEKLKQNYDFDFTLVQGMEREKALAIMSRCDIYIDQLILGAHGYAAIEAMAYGKPVVCYINPIIGKDYPPELPIVNANPDNIAEKLEKLVRNSILRHELGKKGREYVETYHNEKKIAQNLIEIYREVIDLHKKKYKA